jgi:hypothetical protein
MSKKQWDLALKWIEWARTMQMPLPAALQQQVDQTIGVVDETAQDEGGGSEG